MKNFIKKINTVFVLALFLIPGVIFADSYSGYYTPSSYDSYSGYYTPSSYDSYSGYYDAPSYDSYSGYYTPSSYDSYSGYYTPSYDSYSGYYTPSYDSYSGYYTPSSYDSYSGYYDAPSYDSYSGYYTPSYSEPTIYASAGLDWLYNPSLYTYQDYNFGGSGCTSGCGYVPPVYNPPVYTPPPVYVPPVSPLSVICTTSHGSIQEGDSVTFTATAVGGRGNYAYRWSGDASGSSRNVTQRFNNVGTYYATVRVTDSDGQTASANCGSVRVVRDYVPPTYDTLDVICRASDSRPDIDERVTFTATASGGRGSYTYMWYGDVFGSGRTVEKRFFLGGAHYVTVQVTDRDGRQAVAECPVVRVQGDRDLGVTSGTLSSGSTNYPTGNLASVGSVYLNQVPYTGPEDVAKGIAFGVAILAWSIAGALIIRNRMNKKAISDSITAFKEANKARVM